MTSKHKTCKDSTVNLSVIPLPSEVDCNSKSRPLAQSTPKSSRKSSRVTINENVSTVSLKLPPVAPKPEKYKPTPYTFRVPANAFSVPAGNSLVRCPPFYVQLDHTLAVIWSLFSKHPTEKPLGVVQLQWALNFLQGIRNNKGKHPKDVAVCIEAMEEALIEQYAAMADTVKPSKCCSSSCLTKKKSKSSSTSTVRKSSTVLQALTDRQSSMKMKPDTLMQNLPFSVTYAEMSKKRPNRVEQLFKAKGGVSMTGADIQRQLDNLKNAVGLANSEIALGPKYSREDMVEFLKVWRKEQINKLQEELQRLHSIETFIGTLDKDNFKPYLDNQQVDVLATKKVKREESKSTTQSSIESIKKSREHRRK